MAYPFVAARDFTPGAIVEVRALLWHMAEGYGTVSWLTHPRNDNSAHFVIERSGRIVQMVRLADASHSAHVAIDPDDADAADCGIYSDAVGRVVLGSGWSNINRYVVSVEVEGFRAQGPNADQVAAIARLSADLRSRLPSARGNLGHRDVQDYKSCPGCRFPWATIDGHGLFSTEEGLVAIFTRTVRPGTFTIKAGTTPSGYSLAGDTLVIAKRWSKRTTDSSARFVAVLSRTRLISPTPLLEVTNGFFAGLYVATSQVTETFDPEPPDQTAEALTAQAARVRAAVEGALS